jgi:uncharacterized delta-60 repeat protein
MSNETKRAVVCASALWSMQASGAVLLDFGDDTDDALRVVRVAPDDRIVAQLALESGVPCGLLALSADGALDATFDQDGRLTLENNNCPFDLRVRADGSLTSLESLIPGAAARIRVRSPSGAVTMTSPELYPRSEDSTLSNPQLVSLQTDGTYLVVGRYGCRFCNWWTLGRFNADGSPDPAFSPDGDGTIVFTVDRNIRSVHPLPGGKILVSGRNFSPSGTVVVIRLNADGTPDSSFAANGELLLEGEIGLSVVDATGRLHVLTRQEGVVARVLADGTVDSSYAGGSAQPGRTITNLAIDAMNRVVVFGEMLNEGYVARFDTTGNLDATFNGTGEILATLPPLAETGSAGSRCTGAVQSGSRPVLACSVAAESDADVTARSDVALVRFTDAGVLDPTFDDGLPDPDSYPDPFSFPDVTAPYGTAWVPSATRAVAGFTDPARIEVGGAEYSLGCTGSFTDSPGLITSGQTICLQANAALQPGEIRTAFVRVGGRKVTFTVIAGNTPADFVPDAFAFAAQTSVAPGATVTSNTVAITGLTGAANVTVVNGSYSVGCTGSFVTSQVQITNQTLICVQHVASSSPSTQTSTQLTIGGVSATFASTTAAAPAPPPPSGGGGGSGSSSGGGSGAIDRWLLALLTALLLWMHRTSRARA